MNINIRKFLIYEFLLPHILKDVNYPVGGAAVEILALIKGLMHHGCEVGILTWKGAKDFIEKKTDVDIVEAFDRNRGLRKVRWIYNRYPILINAIKNYSPDYLFKETAQIETGILAFIAKRLNLPFIYRIANDMEVDERLKQRLCFYERIMYRYGLKNADYIIAQNDYQYNKARKLYPMKSIYKLYNPFYPLGEIIDERERRYIAWIGIFCHQKNLGALYKIVDRLPKVHFKIAGTEQPGHPPDKNTNLALAALASCKNVQFVGHLDRTEIMNFLAEAYALLNTSHYEGFSNTFLEAFATGTPVISLSSNPDGILSKYKIGFKVSLKTVEHVINELIISYDYKACKVRMKNYLDSFHDYKIVTKKLLNILNT